MCNFADDENNEQEAEQAWKDFMDSEEGREILQEVEERYLFDEALSSHGSYASKYQRIIKQMEQEARNAELNEDAQAQKRELMETTEEDDAVFRYGFFATNSNISSNSAETHPIEKKTPTKDDSEQTSNSLTSLSTEAIRRVLGIDEKNPSTSNEKVSAYAVAQQLIRDETIICVGNGLYVHSGLIYKLLGRDQIYRFIVEKCREAIEMIGEPSFIDKIYKFLFAEPGISYKPQEPSPDLIVFKDGVLNTREWTLKPHSSSIFATTLINVSYRRGELMRCPNFDAFLHDITGGDPLLTQRI